MSLKVNDLLLNTTNLIEMHSLTNIHLKDYVKIENNSKDAIFELFLKALDEIKDLRKELNELKEMEKQ